MNLDMLSTSSPLISYTRVASDPMMKDARYYLKELRTRAGLSIRAMAEALGYNSPSSYQYYEENDKFASDMPWEFVNKVAAALVGKGNPKITRNDVAKLGDANAIEAPDSAPVAHRVDDDDFLAVGMYDIRAAAGAGALVNDEEPETYQPYRRQELSKLTSANTDDLAVITVGGDSMWETLHDGDKVLVDRTVRRIVRDGIYIISIEGELLVKRCQMHPGTREVIVKSDNPAYDTFVIKDQSVLAVIGRVIWIGRALG